MLGVNRVPSQALRQLLAAVAVLISAAGIAAAQVPQPGQGSVRGKPGQALDPGLGPLPIFEFHSGLWLNLHHFLYQQARQEGGEAGPAGKQDKDWSAALEYYRRTLARRDLLVDFEMVAIKDRLAEWEGVQNLQKSGLKAELIAALERAAPIYRARWWAEHDRANRTWVAAVAPMVQRLGGDLAKELARVYQAEWPAGHIRVDVSVYAGRVGGYTTLEPLRVTLSSDDERNQGDAALEVLFHEASHGVARAVSDGIAAQCRARGKPIPRDLWHAVLFYTTGEVVKRAFAPSGASADGGNGNYTPYAYRHGLYDRGPWRGQNFGPLLERYWQPYLDGKLDFEHAIARLVDAL